MVGFVAPAGASAEIPEGLAVNPITPENTPPGSFGDIVAAGVKNSLFAKGLDYAYSKGQARAEMNEPDLTPAQIKEKYGFTAEAPMSNAQAALHQRRLEAEETYDAVSRNAPWYKKFSADSTAFFLDPVNDASLLIPIAGEARVAGMFGKAGLTTSTALGRAGVRAAALATGLAAQQAPLSAINYGLSHAAGIDYSVADGLRDTLFAGAVGVLAGPFAGAIRDAFKGTPEWAKLESSRLPDNQAAARAGLNQLKNELPFDVESVFKDNQSREINFSDSFNGAKTNLLYKMEDLEAYRQQNAPIVGQQPLFEAKPGIPEDNDILQSMTTMEARLEDTNKSLQSPALPPDWRKTLESYRDRLTGIINQLGDFKDMHENELRLAAWRGEISMEDVAKRQAQLIKEGTIMGMPQDELRAVKADAEAALAPEPELHEQLAKAREEADQWENQVRETHQGNAELEHEFKDAMTHKENESMYQSVFQSAIKCMLGVGYV